MKTTFIVLFTLASLFLLSNCSKNNDKPSFSFTNNVTEGQADQNGEYTITGALQSDVNLQKVTLTKEGQNNPFLVDDTEAKNKNSYSFSYLVTGVNANTYIALDAYDQDGGKTTARFLIRK